MTLTQINKAGLDEIALDHVFTIGASGVSAYTFQGEGLNGTVSNPTLYLTRGKTYRFENGTGAHAIRIQSADNGTNGTLYNTGVTNNNTTGTVIVEVQHDAPDVLYYQCANHANMKGILYIVGALADGGVTTAKIADGAVTGAKLANGTLPSGVKVNHNNLQTGIIEDENISSSAAIAGSKISPNFGSQDITTTGHIDLPDASTIKLGDSDEFQIQHTAGGASLISETGSGNLEIRATNINLKDSNANNKLATYSLGVDITGNLNVSNGIDVTGAITGTGDMTIDTNTLHVDSSNNRVGMGTTSPATNLHVSSSGDTILRVTSADGNAAFLDLGDASDPDGGRIHYDSGSNLVFNTASLERMRIDSSGRLFLGLTTTGYPKKLNIQGESGSIIHLNNYDTTTYAANTSTAIEFNVNTGNTGNQTGACEIRAFKENGTNGNNARALSFYTGTNGGSNNERMRITSSGHVLIPDQPCAVVTNATAAGGLNNSQNGVARTFQSTHISQGGMVISNTRSRITVPTSGTYLINILLSGGIATVEAGDGIIMRLRRNGANYPTADSHPVETFGSVTGMEWAFHFNLPVNLSANDYLEVCLDNIGGTVNFGVDRGYFAVNLLH